MVHEPSVHSTSELYCSMTSLFIIGYWVRPTTYAMMLVIFTVCLSLASSPSLAREPEILLVANPNVAIHRLNRDTTRAIISMRQRSWPDGQAVRVFVLDNNHPVHARFTKEQLSVYPHQLQLAWDRMVFSGTGQAPDRVTNQVEMRERVASTPGALGYLEREYLDDSIQVISMD